jgi:hypothetical protein
LAVGVELEGQLVDEREVKALLGDKEGVRRTREQVLTTLKHRITCKFFFRLEMEMCADSGEKMSMRM